MPFSNTTLSDPMQNSITNVPTDTPAYIDGLNPPQREAVEALDGAVLVLAGAGTGKTRVLITRFAHLLKTKNVFPSQILAVTFTNKAALEMRERIAHLTGHAVEGWWLGTFHGLAARLLRRHAEMVGRTPAFTILDSDDQERLIKQIMIARNIDFKRWPPRMLAHTISSWKDKALEPSDLKMDDVGDLAAGQALGIYQDYQARLQTLNAVDFGDLLLLCLRLWRENPDILARNQKQFRYIMVDEYQDTNVAQYLWLRLLAQDHRNICCVGDDDQSIYGWRGAEVGNILRFEKDFPNAKIVRLEQNYRSTQHILAAASHLISHNQGRWGKTLWTSSVDGEKLRIIPCWDGQAEATTIGDIIENLVRKGEKFGSIAILIRAGFQSREFEDRFLTLGLPYRVIGGPRFYERQEIRDALAYLRIIAQPSDDLALERIINTPKRGIGQTALQQLQATARHNSLPLLEAMARLSNSAEIRPKLRATYQQLVGDFDRWRGKIDGLSPAELAELVLDESGYTRMWQEDKSPEAAGRLENLKELVAAIAEFPALTGFLEHISLVMENQEKSGSDSITIMTIHSAKGLEFETVFLPGWEDGSFPHQRAMDEQAGSGLEEERRLAYVAITRARQRVIISLAGQRFVYGAWVHGLPSRFLEELPRDAIDLENTMQGRDTNGRNIASGGGLRGSNSSQNQSYPIIDVTDPFTQSGKPSKIFGGKDSSGTSVDIGSRITHPVFGKGKVTNKDGDRLTIHFDTGEDRKILAGFVKPVTG